MRHRAIPAIAGEPLRAGTFVELRDGQAYSEPTLLRTGGVVQNTGATTFQRGDRLSVLTDGGILTKIATTATITVRRQPCTLYAEDSYYLHLRDGHPVGFQGDERVFM
jgi:hypothetical protein